MTFKKIIKTVLNVLKLVAVKMIDAMRKHNGPITVAGLAATASYFLLGGDDGGTGTTMAVVLAGMAGGSGVDGAPLTVANSREASSELLKSATCSENTPHGYSCRPDLKMGRMPGYRQHESRLLLGRQQTDD